MYDQPAYWKNNGLIGEVKFKASLSGGKGGQHTNKVSTKAELYWKPADSALLDSEQKEKLLTKLSGKLSNEGELRMVCDEERSQLKNKEKLSEKFYSLIASCFKEKKKRKPSKIPKSVIKKRLDNKAKRKETKQRRQRPGKE